MISIPPGYTLLEPRPGLRLLVREGLEPLVERHGLTDFPVPPSTASGDPGPGGGRGAPWLAESGETGPLVIKVYRRGGLARHFRGDTYRGVSRPLEEVRVCLAAQEAGLRVPAIQCLWMEQAGPFHFRLAAATREIPGARNLYDVLVDCRNSSGERSDLLAAVAGEVRKLHDAGIDHPDLNLGNILVAGSDGDPRIHIIDFDKAVLQDTPLGKGERNGALSRIYRSLVKLSLPGPPPLSPEEKDHFISSYWHDKTGPYTALRRRCRRELALHRLWWRINPPRTKE